MYNSSELIILDYAIYKNNEQSCHMSSSTSLLIIKIRVFTMRGTSASPYAQGLDSFNNCVTGR